MRGFVEASNTRCYVCSYLLSRLQRHWPQSLRVILEQLAEGEALDRIFVEEDEDIISGVSYPRADLRSCLRDVIETWDESVSWVSFTVMRIEARVGSEDYRRVSVYLNPSHEGYFPLDTGVYDNLLWDYWRFLATRMPWTDRLLLTSHEDLTSKGLAMTLPSNTGSTETWSTICQWLRVCSELHSCTAKVNRDCQWYPTRLVERMPNDRFRIIRSDSGLFRPGQGYITLSHRWGDHDFVKLTKDNLSEFEKGSQIDKLRKTFQDALIVAQRMDVPYVWIDSLCIIQSGDNGVDWCQESGSMAEVYSNSFCNISADWGDETNGLFFERTPTFEPPCAIQIRMNEYPSMQPDGDPCYLVRRGGWLNNIINSPLNRRGWVLQERLLAPRVLHFLPDQVSWECGELFSWEKAPWHYSHQAPPHGDRDWINYRVCNSTMERVNLNHPWVLDTWVSLLLGYTGCDLTQQSDRLIALAGIAKRMAPVNGQYVAGLWAKSMPEELLWYNAIVDREQLPREDCQYYAPTFSWAAASGTVYPHSPRDEPPDLLFTTSVDFIKHRDRSLDPAATTTMRTELDGQILTDDIFGPLTSPEVEVRVRGYLRSCRRVPPRLVPPKWSVSRTDSYARPSKGVDDFAINQYFDRDTTFKVQYDRARDEDVQSDSTVYYYTIICTRSGIQRGLFLKSVDASMGRFERLGLVTPRGHQHDVICQPLGNERDLPAWSYNETTGEHTFYII